MVSLTSGQLFTSLSRLLKKQVGILGWCFVTIKHDFIDTLINLLNFNQKSSDIMNLSIVAKLYLNLRLGLAGFQEFSLQKIIKKKKKL